MFNAPTLIKEGSPVHLISHHSASPLLQGGSHNINGTQNTYTMDNTGSITDKAIVSC